MEAKEKAEAKEIQLPTSAASLAADIRKHLVFCALIATTLILEIIIAFRPASEQVEYYRREMVEAKSLFNIELSAKEHALANSQKDVIENQKNLAATEKALAENIQALSQVEFALRQARGDTVDLRPVKEARAKSRIDRKVAKEEEAETLLYELYQAKRSLFAAKIAFRDTAKDLALARLKLSDDRAAIRTLSGPADQEAGVHRGTWVDFLPVAAEPLLGDAELRLPFQDLQTFTISWSQAVGQKSSPEEQIGRLDHALGETQAELNQYEANISAAQKEMTETEQQIAFAETVLAMMNKSR